MKLYALERNHFLSYRYLLFELALTDTVVQTYNFRRAHSTKLGNIIYMVFHKKNNPFFFLS